MTPSPTFEWVCAELDGRSSLTTLEVRGTVRLALKQAGLEAQNVTPEQMKVVLQRVMPGELTSRGVDDSDTICQNLIPGLSGLRAGAELESPEDVFRRLSG